MTPASLDAALLKLAIAYEEAADKLITEARAKYVIPYCDRTGWIFTAGMGSWSFHKRNKANTENIYHAASYDDAKESRLPKRLLAALRTEHGLHQNNDLGSLMADYIPKAK